MSLYSYDEGLLNYLKDNLNFPNIINSAESQAFSNIANQNHCAKILLPMVSFWRVSNPVISDGGNYSARSRGGLINKFKESNSGVRWRSLPINISYQITITSDRRKEVDDIFRELMMCLYSDDPHIKVKFQGYEELVEFRIEVTDSDSTFDVDSFDDKGKLYTQNILIDIPEAQLIFASEIKLVKDVEIREYVITNQQEL